MRILIVSRASYALPNSQGGADAYALRTGLLLIPRGHEVYLVGQGRPGPAFGKIRFVRVPTQRQVTSRRRLAYFAKGFLLSIAGVLTAARFLYQHRDEIDVIHSNSNVGALVLKRLFPEKPLVYTLHDPLVSRRSTSRSVLERAIRIVNNGVIEKLALKGADHVIAVSGEVKAQAEQLAGVTGKVSLFYPFASLATTGGKAPPPDRPEPPRPFILSVGAQTGRKRFDLLIRALALDGPELHLVLVGNGPDRDHLVQTVTDRGLEGRVVFYDRVSEPVLSWLYQQAVAFAIVSEREGFPTTLVEATVNGTPTLYVTEGATPDLDGDLSDFFRVIHSLSETDIAEAISSLSAWVDTNRTHRRTIASWARTRFPSGDTVASELSHIYRRVTDPQSPSGPTGASTKFVPPASAPAGPIPPP